jgi:hypothetical protein
MRHRIILDELSEAKKILQNGFSKCYVDKYELGLIAKYYFQEGMKIPEIKIKIIEFSKSHDPEFNEILQRDLIQDCLSNTKLYSLKKQESEVIITISEMDVLRKLERKYAIILLTMLVLAKHEKFNTNIIKKESDNLGYYCKRKFKDIIKISKVKLNENEVIKTKYFLDSQNHFVSATLHSNVWAIKFADDKTESFMKVNDLNNIASFMPYFCNKCGAQIEKRPKMRHDLCDDCYQMQRREYLSEKEKIRIRNKRQNKKYNV